MQPPYAATNGWTAGSDGKVQAEELMAIMTNMVMWTAPLKLFIFNENGDVVNMNRASPYSALLVEGFQASFPFRHVVMFTEPCVRPISQVVPHEFGHFLELAYYDDDGGFHDLGACPGGIEKLMRQGTPVGPIENPVFPAFGKWLRHEDWRVANEEAAYYIVNP